jgi:hypothetical protein
MMCLTVVSLCSLTVLAADSGARVPLGDVTQASQIRHAVNPDAEAAAKKIFSNLGPTGSSYDATGGYYVAGPDSALDILEDIAVPFTPKKNSTITKVKAALQYYNFGAGQTNAAVLGIYKDAAGLPGKKLSSKLLKNFEDFGVGCCDLALWKLATPLPVRAGKQYWVVATTNAKSADALNIWDFVFDDAPGTFAFQQTGTGWILVDASLGYPQAACAVYGTIP